MIIDCPYCSPNVVGQHEANCPLSNYEWNTTMVEHWQVGNDMSEDGMLNPNLDSCEVYPKGWVCPKCGAVWAPGVRECEHCKPLMFVQVDIAG